MCSTNNWSLQAALRQAREDAEVVPQAVRIYDLQKAKDPTTPGVCVFPTVELSAMVSSRLSIDQPQLAELGHPAAAQQR